VKVSGLCWRLGEQCGSGGLRCVEGNSSVEAHCECIEGWTNIGEFALSLGGSCDIHILTVRIIWGLMALPHHKHSPCFDPSYFIIGGELLILYSIGLSLNYIAAISLTIEVSIKIIQIKSEVNGKTARALASIKALSPILRLAMIVLSLLPFIMSLVNNSFQRTQNVGSYDKILEGFLLLDLELSYFAI
jgi:hypothetical protein